MRWWTAWGCALERRAFLGALVGLLLPVPLVLLLGGAMYPWLWGGSPEGRRISPVLDIEERTRRLTYRRYCQQSSECEPPLGCFADPRVMTHYCTDSQCMTDAQCPDGQVCRPLETSGDGPLVRFCVPVGQRGEGEQCLYIGGARDQACGPGLLCSEGWCGRSCRGDAASSCPEGFFCAHDAIQPVCVPTCEARGCPEGQQCVQYGRGTSACAVVYGPFCQEFPCADGRECDMVSASRRPGKVWMECVQECSAEQPTCPEGFACNKWLCQPSCDPEVAGACGEGYRCEQTRSGSAWVCQPDR